MFKRKLCAAILCVSCAASMTACTSSSNYAKVDDNSVEYSTQTSLDPLNYTTYVNKEITLIMNILTTHIAVGDKIAKGSYIVADELTNLEADLDMVAEAVASVEVLNPPTDYEDDRESILRKMVNAQSSLQAYYDALDSDATANLQDYLDLMEVDYVALSGAFNLTWE